MLLYRSRSPSPVRLYSLYPVYKFFSFIGQCLVFAYKEHIPQGTQHAPVSMMVLILMLRALSDEV